MANINLYQTQQTEDKAVRGSVFGSGVVISLVALFVVAAVYGGMMLYEKSLNSKIDDAKAEEESGRSSLKTEDVNSAASFQQKIENIKNDADNFSAKNPSKLFQEVQGAMVPGSVLLSLNQDKDGFSVSFMADNFEVVAKQILGFKKSTMFSNVAVKNSARDQKGKIDVELNMELN